MKSLNKLQVLRMEDITFNASVLHSLGALPSLRELILTVEGLVTKKGNDDDLKIFFVVLSFLLLG